MRVPAQHSNASTFAYGPYDADERYLHGELMAGERVGPPRVRTGRRALLRGIVVILIAFGGAWAVLGDPTTWPVRTWTEWLAGQIAAVTAESDRKIPAPVERVSSAVAVPDSAELTKPIVLDKAPALASQPWPAAKTAIPPSAISPGAPDTPTAMPLTTAALPPPHVDPADPYQVRAEAVGLHPGLSRALLERLSPADYRNAGIAIKTALAETADGAVLVWPRQRKPELALFQVRFVPGAVSDCRRYVVTVIKDRWATTALPMEKCGSQAGRLRRG